MQIARTMTSLVTILVAVVLASFDVAWSKPLSDPQSADFFVAVDGDDANPGTRQNPFATISRARDAVREKIGAGLEADVTVAVRGGVYRIANPIEFGPGDGGTDRFAVSYVACPGEEPILSGGRSIDGWREGADGVWRAKIPETAADQWTFRELFVGGRRAIRARHPNEGYFRVEQVGEDRRTSFRFAEGDLHVPDDLDGVELVFLHDWSITRTPIASIDESTRVLKVPRQIGGPSHWAVMDWFEKHPRYYVENSADFLDAPGEWFLDDKSGEISYRPRQGEKLDRIETVAPVARQLLVVRGEPDRPIRNLHFVGLGCEHAAWFPDERIHWGRQACSYWTVGGQTREADEAAVHFELADGCSFASGHVTHVGRSAVWLGRGCRGSRVIDCEVFDAGGNGIMIGEGKTRMVGEQSWWEAAPEQAATGNVVKNCLVEHCGQELFGAVGVWVGLAAKTEIVHNEIRNLPYTGVSVGWMWWNPKTRPEPRATPCRENLVVDNHIHHVLLTLSDGGGIYTLGTQPGSALRGNLIHDVAANAGRAESNGMFLDQGTGEFAIEENVIYAITRSPLRFHKGWHNRIRNNWLEITPDVPPIRYSPDTLRERIRLEGNQVVEAIPADVLEAARRRAGRTMD